MTSEQFKIVREKYSGEIIKKEQFQLLKDCKNISVYENEFLALSDGTQYIINEIIDEKLMHPHFVVYVSN